MKKCKNGHCRRVNALGRVDKQRRIIEAVRPFEQPLRSLLKIDDADTRS